LNWLRYVEQAEGGWLRTNVRFAPIVLKKSFAPNMPIF
jgi:hypothetical protein